MPENREIEIKFVLDAPATIRDKLLQLGAISHGHRFENNLRLDDINHSLMEQHIVLRLRQSEGAEGSSTQLTVKSPTASSDTSLSIRNEFELEIGDETTMLAALEVLGYKTYWRYEKRRETFVLDDVEAVIDEMPFGWFLEIEGSPEGIRALVKKLGLDMTDGIKHSYAWIFRHVCQTLEINPGDLTFDAFKNVEIDIYVLRQMAK